VSIGLARRQDVAHLGDVEVTPLERKRCSPKRRLEHPYNVGVRHQALQASLALCFSGARGSCSCGPVFQRRSGAQHLRAPLPLSA
jgi:hypothetical protein